MPVSSHPGCSEHWVSPYLENLSGDKWQNMCSKPAPAGEIDAFCLERCLPRAHVYLPVWHPSWAGAPIIPSLSLLTLERVISPDSKSQHVHLSASLLPLWLNNSVCKIRSKHNPVKWHYWSTEMWLHPKWSLVFNTSFLNFTLSKVGQQQMLCRDWETVH